MWLWLLSDVQNWQRLHQCSHCQNCTKCVAGSWQDVVRIALVTRSTIRRTLGIEVMRAGTKVGTVALPSMLSMRHLVDKPAADPAAS